MNGRSSAPVSRNAPSWQGSLDCVLGPRFCIYTQSRNASTMCLCQKMEMLESSLIALNGLQWLAPMVCSAARPCLPCSDAAASSETPVVCTLWPVQQACSKLLGEHPALSSASFDAVLLLRVIRNERFSRAPLSYPQAAIRPTK